MKTLYLVSNDLFSYLNRRLSFPEDKINVIRRYLDDFEFRFLRKLSFFLPENVLLEEITREKIARWLRQQEQKSRYTVISIDDVHSSAKLKIHINRLLINQNGKRKIILSNRPGTLPLNKQIEEIAKSIESKNVAISDIGVWNGYTALFVKKLLSKHGIRVRLGIFPIVRRKALDAISNSFNIKYMIIGNFYEWVELRDLLISGMPIAMKDKPAVIKNVEIRVPYWYDSYTLSKLAGFHEKITKQEKLRAFLIKRTVKLLRKLSSILGREITVSELGYYSDRIVKNIDPNEEVIDRVEEIVEGDLN